MNVTAGVDCFMLPDPEFDLADVRRSTNLLTAVINITTAPFAVLANLLTIYVIATREQLHIPSNVLLTSLALSDLLVGLVVQPCYVAYRVIEARALFVPCPLRVLYSESFWVCYGVSFLTLSAISVERLIALRLHLRYNELVTVQRVFLVALAIWLTDISCTALEWIRKDKMFRKTQAILWPCCLLAACASHIAIFRILRRHQRQISTLHSERHHRYKRQARLAINAAYLVGIYIFCNLPVLIVTAYAFTGSGIQAVSVFSWTETIAFLNSSFSPVICWWRNQGIRRGVCSVLKRMLCCREGRGALGNSARGTSGALALRGGGGERRDMSVIRRHYIVNDNRVGSQNLESRPSCCVEGENGITVQTGPWIIQDFLHNQLTHPRKEYCCHIRALTGYCCLTSWYSFCFSLWRQDSTTVTRRTPSVHKIRIEDESSHWREPNWAVWVSPSSSTSISQFASL